jgi:hypothetical protein
MKPFTRKYDLQIIYERVPLEEDGISFYHYYSHGSSVRKRLSQQKYLILNQQ